MIKRLALIAQVAVVGLALWVGLAYSQIGQTDPWWDPRSPSGQSRGITYGTVLPTLANTGRQNTDGLLAVQIVPGVTPSLHIYDTSTLGWFHFFNGSGLQDNMIPLYNGTTDSLEDSLLSDDGTNVTLTTGQMLAPDGDAPTPSYSFSTDTDNGLYLPGANNVSMVVGAMETMDWNGAAGRTYGTGVNGTVIDIDHGITALMRLVPTMEANDNAGDQRNALLIDFDIPNGSAGLVNGINIDAVVDDINTLDSAIFIEGGFDSAITITERGSASTANPLANTVWIFLDDSVDYSGAGGVDCWVVARDANGNNHQMAQIVLNGVCP